jgi:hypothetical protein
MPYSYAVYSVQDQVRTNATNVKIDAMEKDGWRPHTVNCNFAELCIFWVKDAPGDDSFEEEPETSGSVRSGSSSGQGGGAS